MAIPLGNILSSALSITGYQDIRYYRYQGTETNKQGIDVIRYDRGNDYRGNVQPVFSGVYHERGLDYRKHYIDVWLRLPAKSTERARSGDQLTYDSQRWQVTDTNDWFSSSGWGRFTAVRVDEL